MRLVTVHPLAEAGALRLVHMGGLVRMAACSLTEDRVELPETLLESAGLKPGDAVHAYAPDEGHIHLGPYVGVLLGQDGMAVLHGDRADRYREIARMGREAGVVPSFFQWTDVDLAAGTVGAWTDQAGTWERVSLPIPDVIYNRATHPDPAEREAVKALFIKMRALYGTCFVNRTNAFSKMAVYEALRFFEPFAPLTPETQLLRSEETLADMLKRHAQVFLKANHGTHGTDVVRVRPHEDAWQVTGQCGGKAVDESFAALSDVPEFLQLLRGDLEWVVQQGIALTEVEGRRFDLRILLQKDGEANWVVPLVLIRLAQPGKVTANMSQGADPFLPPGFRARFGEAVPADLEEKAVAAARKVAIALESSCGLLGEIGIDLGLDQDGRPWVFEANAKPLHPQFPGMEHPLYDNPFRYACHIAKSAWSGRHSGIVSAQALEHS